MKKPLLDHTAEFKQTFPLSFGFNAFDNDFLSVQVGDVSDHFDNLAVLTVLDFGDEEFINLDDIKGYAFKDRKR